MLRVTLLRAQLLVLMHLCGGMPARATEILSIRHRNTSGGDCRDVFVDHGLIVFVTQYHKGYGVSGGIKIIHRYVPQEVGALVMHYLWLVLPFQELLEATLRQRVTVSSQM